MIIENLLVADMIHVLVNRPGDLGAAPWFARTRSARLCRRREGGGDRTCRVSGRLIATTSPRKPRYCTGVERQNARKAMGRFYWWCGCYARGPPWRMLAVGLGDA
jgi:hypothetical protein